MNQKNIIVAIFVLLLLSIGLIFMSMNFNNSGSIDQLPEDGLSIDTNSQANIIAPESLLTDVGSVGAFDSLGRDLFVFGSTAYEPYVNKTTELIGFKVTNTEIKNDKLFIEGRFGSSKNHILVAVTKLKNDKIYTSITDSKTDLNIDNSLPSNSLKNQFIGTLPYDNNNYVIDYVEDDDFFTVNIVGDGVNTTDVLSFIEKSIGKDNFNPESIFIYGSGGSSIINNDF